MSLRVGVNAIPLGREAIDYVVQADQLGADSLWVPEFWGYDALTPLGALATVTESIQLGTGIAQLGARTPAMLAMSAATLQTLSNGRFVLGLGASGPQVMEGWHGVEFSRPVQRTRETVEILRMIWRGDKLVHDGQVYQVPLPTGEGRALRLAAPPVKVPVYLASLGPSNLRLTGQVADGWIGNSFLCASAGVFLEQIATGAAAAGRTLDEIDLTVSVSCEITDDIEEAGRRHADGYAFTFGAMGSDSSNFYLDAFARQGFEQELREVQRLWIDGERQAAAAAVPIEIGLQTNLIGPPHEIRRRLREYRDCGVNTLRVNPIGETLQEQVDGLALLLELVDDVNSELHQ